LCRDVPAQEAERLSYKGMPAADYVRIDVIDTGTGVHGAGLKLRHFHVIASQRVGTKRRPMTGSAKQSSRTKNWVASSLRSSQ
jgi:hypothetical protein